MHIGRIAREIRDPVRDETAAPVSETRRYDRLFPYHAELCALSEIRKRPGFGAEFRSGAGGHSLLYLSGVRLDRAAGYPVLRLCSPEASPADHGVGISVNSHYANANWVAAEGRDFVFFGALAPEEPLTRAAYARTQERAKAMGVLDGIVFHEHFFRDKPASMSRRDYMYDISIGTDYAVRFGRAIYRAKIPLDRRRMETIVDFLNALNAPYRDGRRVYRWRLFNDNCSHVAHNALAAAGVWAPWPTGRFFALEAFNFPVPKNELLDLIVRANDLPLDEPHALYADWVARRALLELDFLPTTPGGLVAIEPAVARNEVYETERLRLIFYERPLWGKYQRRLTRILGEPRYFDLQANLCHFAALYQKARAHLPTSERDGGIARFLARYESYLDREMARVDAQLAALTCPTNTASAPVLM